MLHTDKSCNGRISTPWHLLVAGTDTSSGIPERRSGNAVWYHAGAEKFQHLYWYFLAMLWVNGDCKQQLIDRADCRDDLEIIDAFSPVISRNLVSDNMINGDNCKMQYAYNKTRK